MALVKTDLVLMGDGRAYKDYRYESTSDTLATIEADAYFDSLADMFRTNDLIEAWGTDGYRKYKVTRSASDIALSVVDFENAVTTATTSGNLPNFGTVIVPAASTAAAYTIDDPIAGLEVTLVQDNTTTTGFTVTANTTGVGFNQAGDNVLTFNGADDAVVLRGLSTTKWRIVSNVGSVAFS